ncbi:DUF3060 domain-containing protein [Mycobacterium sp. GA-2829]|uniref:DUF3060 domain-containing protein n=1 Tax=Mycobacterium sp. GA-2829 TaxID=1772283 RepID=UPI00073FDF76|nr:DUF3060 domain-containing protein [Mycobacterium sp. GA-2829]KUI39222.1 hypothetical protein AU194_14415 [Mycobacterium sp. GA-2829]
MNPQDDPEARIRDLERPLADRASELGTQPYTAAAYPDAVYGVPYPPTPPRGPSRTGVVVLVVVVLTLLVLGAGVAIYFAKAPRDGAVTAGRPTIAGGGGALDQIPETLVEIPPLVIPPGGGDAVAQAPPGGQFSVSGVEGNKRVACSDSLINVSGVSNTVTITGHCTTVVVSGVGNEVVVESADEIRASGFENRVTYQSGDPKIDSFGDNVVERG